MIDNWYEWKNKYNIDNLTVDDFPYLNSLGAFKFIGKDKFGRPIGFGCSRYIFPS